VTTKKRLLLTPTSTCSKCTAAPGGTAESRSARAPEYRLGANAPVPAAERVRRRVGVGAGQRVLVTEPRSESAAEVGPPLAVSGGARRSRHDRAPRSPRTTLRRPRSGPSRNRANEFIWRGDTLGVGAARPNRWGGLALKREPRGRPTGSRSRGASPHQPRLRAPRPAWAGSARIAGR